MTGMVSVPATSDGRRSNSGVWPSWVVSQEATKYSGGVISACLIAAVP